MPGKAASGRTRGSICLSGDEMDSRWHGTNGLDGVPTGSRSNENRPEADNLTCAIALPTVVVFPLYSVGTRG